MQFSRVLDMAKLQTSITYNQRKEKSNSTMAYINVESEELELPNTNLDEHNKDSNNGENVLVIETDIVGKSDDESDSDDDVEESQIQDQLDQWLKMLQESNENINDLNLDLDIESIDHPAENSNAKWDLKVMFKDNLHCPF
ncbi:hypothetical protein RclHR1_00650021 [Rhizophagus clarus]|uniref:Uncharacterized protein n=1 Tax=Rhizophagus clarus TaxID=94130 RepID=A0A2Z6SA53_9GLOM|nr:hypothetical protein RclHR1_00650021 [Rhizophagus clarus]